METQAYTLKAIIVTAFSAISAFLGWYGWLLIVWIVSMLVDWLTGSAAALKNGEWCSRTAREGLFHKGGCIVVVCAGLLLDLLVWTAVSIVPEFHIEYQMYLSAVIMVWYTVTELGSIVENAGKLGAPVPRFLIRGIKVLKCRITKIGDKAIGAEEDEQERTDNTSETEKDTE